VYFDISFILKFCIIFGCIYPAGLDAQNTSFFFWTTSLHLLKVTHIRYLHLHYTLWKVDELIWKS